MPSLIARAHQPVVRLIGRRLAAADTPERVRRVIAVAGKLMAPVIGVTATETTFGPRGGLEIVPMSADDPDRTVVMFHGGGYVFGSPGMYRGLAGRIAKAAGATVLVPDYRLAPEHPHPAAVDDGLAAYRAILERTDRFVMTGDSAGGGLVLAVLAAARAEGLPMPAGAILMSPWLDLRPDPGTLPNAASELLIRPPIVRRASAWYTGDTDRATPAISPGLAVAAGLPPLLVQVSSSELLYDETIAYVERARAAGVDVTLEVEDRLWHVWQLMAPAVPESRASIRSVADFIASRLG